MGLKKGDGHKKRKLLQKNWRTKAEKRKQIERIESLTEEKSERMRSSDAGVERMDL